MASVGHPLATGFLLCVSGELKVRLSLGLEELPTVDCGMDGRWWLGGLAGIRCRASAGGVKELVAVTGGWFEYKWVSFGGAVYREVRKMSCLICLVCKSRVFLSSTPSLLRLHGEIFSLHFDGRLWGNLQVRIWEWLLVIEVNWEWGAWLVQGIVSCCREWLKRNCCFTLKKRFLKPFLFSLWKWVSHLSISPL